MISLQGIAQLDLAFSRSANRACVHDGARRFFALISWLGNGKFWYALMLLLAVVGGGEGLSLSLHMAQCGVVGVLVYKLIKQRTKRPRPYAAHGGIMLGAAPLDQFSFPSGHSLHAVMFTILACSVFPALALVLVPFTLLVAASRVILGLHYATDVVLGAALGALLAWTIPPLY